MRKKRTAIIPQWNAKLSDEEVTPVAEQIMPIIIRLQSARNLQDLHIVMDHFSPIFQIAAAKICRRAYINRETVKEDMIAEGSAAARTALDGRIEIQGGLSSISNYKRISKYLHLRSRGSMLDYLEKMNREPTSFSDLLGIPGNEEPENEEPQNLTLLNSTDERVTNPVHLDTLNQQYMAIIGEKIADFPERERKIFIAIAIDQKTYEEIAGSMNISTGSARQAYSRTLKRLAKALGDVLSRAP